MGRSYPLDLHVQRKGRKIADLRAEADPKDTAALRKLLLDAVRRDGKRDDQIGEYEMEVRYADSRSVITTFVATG